MSKSRNKKVKDIKRATYAATKTRENIMQPDDALVEDVSDGEVDLGFVGTPRIVDVYEALDPGAVSDGANSWHLEEIKTPLPGQSLWEKFLYTQPQAPNIRRRPGALTKKRRKDADEGNNGNKKAKPSESLKRHLKPFTCRYCRVKGHTKRGCLKKRLDEVAAADKAKSNVAASASEAGPPPQTNTAASASEAGPPPQTDATPANNPPAVEIDISQPNYEGSQDIAGPAAPAPPRPQKLPTKRKSSPPPQFISVDPM
ncbi:uncharacterized protein LOC110270081 [Arachis ipaensis]|nr:uncharacterized protein LOC110270081 [Arachis ipaensis]XP_025643875.1 uncharacterized protein LOC112737935 [Arachis hypogaea]